MEKQAKPLRFSIWRAIGPAIITASVVLGPGSILSSSQIGYHHGYTMCWMLALAVAFMVSMTALSARLGVVLENTLCEELARRVGRWAAVITGVALFLIAACFQFGNNTGVLAALEPFLPDTAWATWFEVALIVFMNAIVVVALFGFQHLYMPLERLMKFLVILMIIGFAGNLLMARPNLLAVLAGFIPQVPEGAAEAEGQIVDKVTPVIAMFLTTFSMAGAFYQSYLVRQKGWGLAQLREGLVDSITGICVLGLVTLMVMVTAGAVLYGNPEVSEPESAADVAVQLQPAFGAGATVLFCMGIFAGAFSSFLVNAMIGGTILSDSLGLGGDIDKPWPKRFTVLALAVGMVVALLIETYGINPVTLIIFAQAVTVLGLPALALTITYLAVVGSGSGQRRVPTWMKLVAFSALVIVTLLAVRQAAQIWLKVTGA